MYYQEFMINLLLSTVIKKIYIKQISKKNIRIVNNINFFDCSHITKILSFGKYYDSVHK